MRVYSRAKTTALKFQNKELENSICLASLCHDMSKVGKHFVNRIRHNIGSGIDHWTGGFRYILDNSKNLSAAIPVLGHHIGLKNRQFIIDMMNHLKDPIANPHPGQKLLSDPDYNQIVSLFQTHCPREWDLIQTYLKHPLLTQASSKNTNLHFGLMTRMILSVLVDSDFLQTEFHFTGKHRPIPPVLNPIEDQLGVDTFLTQVRNSKATSSPILQTQRDALRQQCLTFAENTKVGHGVFSLTAPTGSGKTLSVLSMALKIAERFNKVGIIVAQPFLTITDQTAQLYRDVLKSSGYLLPNDYILEHHTNAYTSDTGNYLYNQQVENWDSPYVITTTVQLFESMFTDRTQKARKLHNMHNRIILIDEFQSLPKHLLAPSYAMMLEMAEHFNCMFVLMTATQPDVNNVKTSINTLTTLPWKSQEIITTPLPPLQKVKIRIHPDTIHDQTELAKLLSTYPSVCCVLNTKKDARLTYKAYKALNPAFKNIFHISTSMCAMHRKKILSEIRLLLDANQPVVLITTQCIEAGTDIDFPVLWRHIAPLDSIDQAIGRCNREGKLTSFGEVVIFKLQDNVDNIYHYPDPRYQYLASLSMSILKTNPYQNGITDFMLKAFYRKAIMGADNQPEATSIREDIRCIDFENVGKNYKLILDDTVSILVPYDQKVYDQLCKDVEVYGANRKWMRMAQAYCVNVFTQEFLKKLQPSGKIKECPLFNKSGIRVGTSENFFILRDVADYSNLIGLIVPQ